MDNATLNVGVASIISSIQELKVSHDQLMMLVVILVVMLIVKR